MFFNINRTVETQNELLVFPAHNNPNIYIYVHWFKHTLEKNGILQEKIINWRFKIQRKESKQSKPQIYMSTTESSSLCISKAALVSRWERKLRLWGADLVSSVSNDLPSLILSGGSRWNCFPAHHTLPLYDHYTNSEMVPDCASFSSLTRFIYLFYFFC